MRGILKQEPNTATAAIVGPVETYIVDSLSRIKGRVWAIIDGVRAVSSEVSGRPIG